MLGINNFPYGLAAVEKHKLFALSLLKNPNVTVEVVCNNSYSKQSVKKRDVYNNIPYRYTSIYTYRGANIFSRRINAYYGIINEIRYLIFNPFDVLLVSTRNFTQILLYVIISRLKRTKIFLTAVEDKNVVPANKSVFDKIDNFLYQKYAWKLVTGALPISEELSHQIRASNPRLPQLKVPVLVNFESFAMETEVQNDYSYFLFCGAAAYYNTIHFIIESYIHAHAKSKLVLVINGSSNQIKKIETFIEFKGGDKKIVILTNLPYRQLINYYKSALALLIPLDINQQDKARFPHKIGEYSACMRPIISSNWGEVKHYFRDMENALLIDNYDTNEMAKKMKLLEDNRDLGNFLGENSFSLGYKQFNYKNYSKKLYEFFNMSY